ncbi:MAG TPA: NAD(P)/FAD-dependent oxidoreductase [Povalibacter sp.]
MDSIDAVVVGAGVVGLAIGRALAQRGLETLVLERNARPGEETTSRNSGVIHSGIYYPTGSLKARLCVRGRDLLYEYCAQRGIAHRRCGKIIVAGKTQIPQLHALHRKAADNGVTDLELLDADQIQQLEPLVKCAAGLLSPSTGIIDVHELLVSYIGDLESHGGMLVLNSEITHAQAGRDGFVLRIRGGNDDSSLQCRLLINCAGLNAVEFLQRLEGYPQELLRTAYVAKGNYFSCQGVRPFKRLVYPMPESAGLGIHATLDLDGTTRFGPDVEWVSELSYKVDPSRAESFYAAIREYWPAIPEGVLQPAYAGMRPKLVGPGSTSADFVIEDAGQHGLPGLINLLGIESPGLTSSPAIGEYVADLVNAA